MLFLAVRLLSAVAGPLFATFVDRVRFRWGKYKPWLLIFAVPVGVFGVLTFTPFGGPPALAMALSAASYLLFGLCTSLAAAATSGMGPAITKDITDRLSMGRLSFVWVMLGATAVGVIGRPAYRFLGQGDDGKGLMLLMGCAAGVGLLVALFQVLRIRERYVAPPKRLAHDLPFRERVRIVAGNRTALIVYATTLASSLSNGVRSALGILYLKYWFQDESLIVLSGLSAMVSTLLGVLLSGPFVRRLGVRASLVLSAAVQIATLAAVSAAPRDATGVTVYLAANALGGLLLGLATPAQGTLMPAAMDYTEYHAGRNLNSFLGSFTLVASNVGAALAGALAAGGLSVVGYVAGVDQTPQALVGLRLLAGLVPAVLMLPALLVAKYDLTEERQKEMAHALIERHEADVSVLQSAGENPTGGEPA